MQCDRNCNDHPLPSHESFSYLSFKSEIIRSKTSSVNPRSCTLISSGDDLIWVSENSYDVSSSSFLHVHYKKEINLS